MRAAAPRSITASPRSHRDVVDRSNSSFTASWLPFSISFAAMIALSSSSVMPGFRFAIPTILLPVLRFATHSDHPAIACRFPYSSFLRYWPRTLPSHGSPAGTPYHFPRLHFAIFPDARYFKSATIADML